MIARTKDCNFTALAASLFVFSAAVPSLSYAGSETANTDALTAKISEMPYSQARPVVLQAGWQPVQNPVPDDLAFFSRAIYEQGYVEVAMCSPVGETPCIFYFKNAQGQYLKVQTLLEVPHVASVSVLKNEAAYRYEARY
ncbi:hypothetical protein [Roseibium aggregatum]|uniref:Uncharacterized protein n=1 Tax=Roseibium aggregatum TaxID=187304 RepID=A0A939EHH3_9HYPH|nr:hypothetical protein [Roseibium aggregatum]MBN9673291.1 hypothetical protein [Roseibium aggregatum]